MQVKNIFLSMAITRNWLREFTGGKNQIMLTVSSSSIKVAFGHT